MVERSAPPAGSPSLTRLASEFASSVRGKGQVYFASGRVSVIEDGANLLAAEVTGQGARYLALFVVRGGELRCSCTCPYFEREQAGCKHLWAVALAGAHRALFAAKIAGRNPLIFDPRLSWDDGEGNDDDSDEDDENSDQDDENGDQDDDPALLAAVARSAFSAAPQPRAVEPRGVAWQEIERSVGRTAVSSASPEIRYFLAQDFDGSWLLSLGKRKRGAEFGPLTPVTRTSQLEAREAVDRELLSLIQTAELTGMYYGSSPRGTQIPGATLELLLPRLTASARCHLLPGVVPPELAKVWRAFGAGVSVKSAELKALPTGYAPLLQLPTLAADGDGLWELELRLTEPEGRRHGRPLEYEARGELVRGELRRPVDQVRLVQRAGTLLFADGTVSGCDAEDTHWLRSLRDFGYADCVLVPSPHLAAFL